MTDPLRPCGWPGCRLCNPVPVEEPEDSLPMLLVTAAAIITLFVLLFIVWPVL